jgi:predicted HicB family RNase H-like nuclease
MKGKAMATVQFVVRMPADMREWISIAAKKNDRSMNWFIVSILKGAMDAQKESAPTAGTVEAPI